MTTTTAGACKLGVRPEAVERGLAAPLFTWGGVAVCTSDTIAYLTSRGLDERIVGTDRLARELGVIAYGPGATDLAEKVTEQIRTRDRKYRSKSQPMIKLYPADTPDDQLADAFIIDKRHTRLALTWADA